MGVIHPLSVLVIVTGDHLEKVPCRETCFASLCARRKKLTTESFVAKGSLFMKRLYPYSGLLICFVADDGSKNLSVYCACKQLVIARSVRIIYKPCNRISESVLIKISNHPVCL